MASLKDNISAYVQAKLGQFRQVMTQPRDFSVQVPQAVSNYAQQVQENKQTPFFNSNNTPTQWLGKVAQDVKKRGAVEGLHDLSYPVTMNPYVQPLLEPVISSLRVNNYKAGSPLPLVNSLLGMPNRSTTKQPNSIAYGALNALSNSTFGQNVKKDYQFLANPNITNQQKFQVEQANTPFGTPVLRQMAASGTLPKPIQSFVDKIYSGKGFAIGDPATVFPVLYMWKGRPTIKTGDITEFVKSSVFGSLQETRDMQLLASKVKSGQQLAPEEAQALTKYTEQGMLNMVLSVAGGLKDVNKGKINLSTKPEVMPEQARADFKKKWSEAYGSRPATIEEPSLLQQRKMAGKPLIDQPLEPLASEGKIKIDPKLLKEGDSQYNFLREKLGWDSEDYGMAKPEQRTKAVIDFYNQAKGGAEGKARLKLDPNKSIKLQTKVGGEISLASENRPASLAPDQSIQSPQQSLQNPLQSGTKPVIPSADLSRPYFNTNRLNVNEKAKTSVTAVIDEVKPAIEKVVGKTLSNKEAKGFADTTARVMDRVTTRQETLAWEAKMLKARQLLAKQATDGTVTQEYMDNLLAVKSQGTDIARKLQSLGIGADPKEVTAKQAILEAVLKVTDDADAILKKAQGVDFNNYEQASAFYREFIKPTAGDWLDKVRYSSMLSSPNTHINNASSNFQGTGIIAPLEKTLTGQLDWLASTVNPKRPRQQFAGEGLAYTKGYYSNLRNAAKNFTDTLTGKKLSSAQEMYQMPLSSKGTVKRGAENVLSLPGRLLQAADEFFQTLTESGSKAGLEYRQSKGVKVLGLEEKAYLEGRKRLFNSEFGLKDDGYILKALEFIPMKVAEARANPNPVISTTAKYTFPFVRVPSNILKASVEYSPLGVSTTWGATNKVNQMAKAIMGTSIGLGTAMLVSSDRMTWAEPTDNTKRNAFRAAGMQPYAVKIGNIWVNYSKLHPAISFNLALVAAIRDAEKNKKLDSTQVDTLLAGVAKWVNFYADMSYVKNIGDVVSGVKGDVSAGARFASNYVQQVIPYRALMGWVTRIVDPYQRQVDPDGSILDKQLQQISTQIPFLSQTVPARMSKGVPIENPHRFINAVSPARVTTENPSAAKTYNQMVNISRANSLQTQADTKYKQQVESTGKPVTAGGYLYYKGTTYDSKTGSREETINKLRVSQTPTEIYKDLPKEYEQSSDAPHNIISKVITYGTGFFKDREGTLNAIATGQPIRKIRGDAVVVERLAGLASLDSKDANTQVDHIVAVALGGDNSENNLRIIPKNENLAKGVVDTYLADLLDKGTITKAQAQERDRNWKNEYGNLSAQDQAKVRNYLTAPVTTPNKINTGILNTLAGRTYKPILDNETQNYADVQLKLPDFPTTTGQPDLDKDLWSKFSGKLTTQVTNIGKLYLSGQITAQEANDGIVAIKSLQSAISKATAKPKKLSVKKVTFKKTSKTKLAKIKIKPLDLRSNAGLSAPKFITPKVSEATLESLRHPKV